MEQNYHTERKYVDYSQVLKAIWNERRLLYKVWACTFILSCIWIFPQPRTYICEVKLAPEVSGEDVGNLSSIASSFGFDIGGATSQDAIYPELYPELFESSEFIVGLYDIQITTKDHKLQTDYFTYIKEHQKKNPLTWPFIWTTLKLTSLFESEDTITSSNGQGGINPFTMSRKDYMLMQNIMEKISCSVDKKTSVITIKVQDQDPLVCAIMADSVKAQLQNFIIRYRTSKVVEDVVHYQQLRDSAEAEYDLVMQAYSRFCDTHNDIILQSYQSERDKLESELALKQNSLTAIEAQLQTTKVKLREKTPAFTTLKSATVPVKPAGPKRVLFIALMMVLSTIGGSIYILRKIIKKSI